MPQQTDKLKCGCGAQFDNRTDFDKHAKTCPMAQSSQQGQPGGQKTRSAG